MVEKKKRASKTAPPARARLFLSDEGRGIAARAFPAAAAALEKHFVVDTSPPEAERAFANEVAERLRTVTHSSESECPYFACVVSGVDLEDDRAFFGALGIGAREKARVGGREREMLSTAYGPVRRGGTYEEHTSTRELLTMISDEDLEDEPDEYLGKEELEVYERAGTLLETRDVVVGGVLCAADGATLLVFALARAAGSDASWSGVMTFRVET